MPSWLGWTVWIVEGLIGAIALRAALRRLLPGWLGDSPLAVYFVAPFVFVVLAGIPAQLAGFKMYGFDASDWRQQVAYWNIFFAPWGVPLICGIPVLLILDLARTIWNAARSNAPGD